MKYFNEFTREAISTGIVFLVVFLLRLIASRLIRSFAKRSQTIEKRTRLVIKYIHLFGNILAGFALVIIWGVNTKDIIIAISSFTTVVGVAMIAQWSILSNITSGIILFFYFPFKIGDVILIHDKEFPIEGEIEDIRAFHVYLKATNGEMIVYPNNMLIQKGISIIKKTRESVEFID